jgi:hypothetical protein
MYTLFPYKRTEGNKDIWASLSDCLWLGTITQRLCQLETGISPRRPRGSCGLCGGQSGTGASSSTVLVSPTNHHSSFIVRWALSHNSRHLISLPSRRISLLKMILSKLRPKKLRSLFGQVFMTCEKFPGSWNEQHFCVSHLRITQGNRTGGIINSVYMLSYSYPYTGLDRPLGLQES